MVLATKYSVVLMYSSAGVTFQFDSILEVKDFLNHLTSDAQMLVHIYKLVYTLDTTTHLVSITTTELTS